MNAIDVFWILFGIGLMFFATFTGLALFTWVYNKE